ncbi:glycosyl transferase [Bernardetia litoralis DSM 6794]|uniref:Glycosyl transferase n=1 Tax=Bernardetia litoralis (strain ATCC 23117 / DSM 6794 / NBRC 15988 / NCIMB 1366 / Fx l1 / Sio-4) TaxID=880071 RepID=I4AGV2_BERLS|nr:glycosyltransferase [Bernardetia litoralis]AFM03187.1 glycosyl transferase [Bernardetia litoralis DSM 6794]
MTKFSFIVPYRNRDTQIAKRCLLSLQNQIFNQNLITDYEVIFIDYGSDKAISDELESFCADLDKVNYVFNNVRGFFWSRSASINNGIYLAKGEYCIIADVDMIYSPIFLEEVDKNINQNTLLHYQCFYLNEGFEYDKYLENHSLKIENTNQFEKSSKESAMGIVVIPTQKLKEIGAFDEYYKLWGVEDKDLNRRLLNYDYSEKLEMKWLNTEKSPVFHQWHPAANNPLAQPKGWEKIVIDHYHNKYDKPKLTIHKKTNGIEIGKIYTNEERPALGIYEKCYSDNSLSSNFSFDFPIEKSYSSFVSQFMKLDKNESLILNQSFSLIDEKATSKAAQGVRKINNLLEKVKVSYRMTELLKHTYGNIDFYQVRDFLFYFIVDFEDFIEDYYYKQENGSNGKPEKITLILFKK